MKELHKKRLKNYLPAIKELIKHYKSFRWYKPLGGLVPCPLCTEADNSIHMTKKCTANRCPWVVFTGEPCFEQSFHGHSRWRRIARLKKWKRKIEEGVVT